MVTNKGSPLHMAAKEGCREILILLLDKDVDVNVKDNHGKTAIELCTDL
jgi:ankyrin repeat protein